MNNMKWFNKKNRYFLSASIICGEPLKLADEISELEEAGIDSLHFDVMDGHFVPRIGLHPEMLKAISGQTDVPIDVHLMISEPQKYIPVFADAGADVLTVHAESEGNLVETLKMIRDRNIKAGIAVKPATSLSILDSALPYTDFVLLMAIQPGILGQKIIPETFDKIKELSEKLKNHPDIVIEVDGGVTPQTAPEMLSCGAHMLVCGTGTIYRPHEDSLTSKIKGLRALL